MIDLAVIALLFFLWMAIFYDILQGGHGICMGSVSWGQFVI